ncbi:MAG TPA: aldo/keto reductase [Thermoplasmata archaeon]|nr:aldo/keto reductase [Thermoplasmata archaeon]
MTAKAKAKPPSRAPGRGHAPKPTAPVEIGSVPLAVGPKRHPLLGLGLWGLGRWSAEDEARTKATIARAYELGVRWFDTAEVYGAGRSERLVGEVLRRAAGGAEDALVVTKLSWEHLRAGQVRASLVRSLDRLGRRSVDLYLVHAPDPHVPLAETMGALEALWKEGRVGAIGVSNFSVAEMEEAARHLSGTRLVVNQVRYNLFDRDDAEAVLPYCREHGIVVEAYTPLARGLLHGRYLDGRRPPAEVRQFAQDLFGASRLPEIVARARALRELATASGTSLPSIALHWLRARGAAPVFGASRPAQVDANLAAWASRPSEDVLERADAIARGERA